MRVFRDSLLVVLTLISFVLGGASLAQAAEGRKHIEAYAEYNKALEAGDYSGAVQSAERAWRLAEEEIGDHQTTAILAYNYASLIYWRYTAAALEPLERAVEISGENTQIFGEEPATLMLLVVKARHKKAKPIDVENLEAALAIYKDKKSPSQLLYARAFSQRAINEMGRNKFNSAEKSADISVAICRYI